MKGQLLSNTNALDITEKFFELLKLDNNYEELNLEDFVAHKYNPLTVFERYERDCLVGCEGSEKRQMRADVYNELFVFAENLLYHTHPIQSFLPLAAILITHLAKKNDVSIAENDKPFIDPKRFTRFYDRLDGLLSDRDISDNDDLLMFHYIAFVTYFSAARMLSAENRLSPRLRMQAKLNFKALINIDTPSTAFLFTECAKSVRKYPAGAAILWDSFEEIMQNTRPHYKPIAAFSADVALNLSAGSSMARKVSNYFFGVLKEWLNANESDAKDCLHEIASAAHIKPWITNHQFAEAVIDQQQTINGCIPRGNLKRQDITQERLIRWAPSPFAFPN